MISSKACQDELVKLQQQLGDLFTAEEVVKAAKDKKQWPALYNYFEWDDKRAGHAHRLLQARQLILHVQIVQPGKKKPMRAYVSLKSDRYTRKGGGYRTIASVMSNEEQREELLSQAFEDLKHWQKKYKLLKELEPIFAAAQKVEQRAKRKKVSA
jgi:hypothetical protein